MSEQWTWQPVDEPIGPVEIEVEYYTHGDGDTATHYEAGYLGDEWVSLGDDVVTTINWGAHEDYRLCRRVPASVPASAPEAAPEPSGLYGKYIVSKSDGSPTDPNAQYFVLRLDTDPAACHAMLMYAGHVWHSNPQLAEDIRAWVAQFPPAQSQETDDE